MEIKRVPISEVEVWEKNPRNIKTRDFERLKRQIQELGIYKPLICFRENGKYVTLGGNMRLRALGSLGVEEVEVSIVEARDEATKIKYALSDNDRVGQYDEQALAELTYPHIEEINLEDYKIDIGQAISLKNVIENFAPDLDEREDEIPEIDDSPAVTKKGDSFQLGKHRLFCGDCLEVMKKMPDGCIDMVITSPPYWGLRDYGFEQIFGGDKDCEHEWNLKEKQINMGISDKSTLVGYTSDDIQIRNLSGKNIQGFCSKCQAWKGQFGLEPTPEIYIEHLTEIFNEVKRILKKEGTFWLNIADTYFGSGCGTNDYRTPASISISRPKLYDGPRPQNIKKHSHLKPKSLTMIPERLAWSLIQNGWILRNKNIWHKRNAMPSSVTDRFSNTYEFVYMFSKSQKYFFDLDAVREPHTWIDKDNLGLVGKSCKTEQYAIHNKGRLRAERYNELGKNPGDVFEINEELRKKTKGEIMHEFNPTYPADRSCGEHPSGKNPGDVFEINTQPFPEAHFAVFPEKLCEKPIKAGCSEQVCKRCGKARERITEGKSKSAFNIGARDTKAGRFQEKWGKTQKPRPHYEKYAGDKKFGGEGIKTIGWTSCKCKAGFEGGIVLDPFLGAGTTLIACEKLNRICYGIEIEPKYCDLTITRYSNFKDIPEKEIRATRENG